MRSKYIYLIYEAGCGPYSSYRHPNLLGAFTVKREANEWLKRSPWSSVTASLWRSLDGLSEASEGAKRFVKIDWS